MCASPYLSEPRFIFVRERAFEYRLHPNFKHHPSPLISPQPTPDAEDDMAFLREIYLAVRTRNSRNDETDDSPALVVKRGGEEPFDKLTSPHD